MIYQLFVNTKYNSNYYSIMTSVYDLSQNHITYDGSISRTYIIDCLKQNINVLWHMFHLNSITKYDILAENPDSMPLLLIACYYGRYDHLYEFIEKLQTTMNCKEFVKHKHNKFLNPMSAKEIMSVVNKDGENLLYIACNEGHTNIIKMLIEKFKLTKNDVFHETKSGFTPFSVLCSNSRIDLIDYFIQTFNLQTEDIFHWKDRKFDWTHLARACAMNHIEVVQLLINYLIKNNKPVKEYIMATNIFGMNSLMYSCINHNNVYLPLVQLILSHCDSITKEDILKKDNQGRTILHHASRGGCITTMQLFLQLGNIKKEDIYSSEMKDIHGKTIMDLSQNKMMEDFLSSVIV